MKKITLLVAVLATALSYGQIDEDFTTSPSLPSTKLNNYKAAITTANETTITNVWFPYSKNGNFETYDENGNNILRRKDIDKQNALGRTFKIENAGIYKFSVTIYVYKDSNAQVSLTDPDADEPKNKTIQFNFMEAGVNSLKNKQKAFYQADEDKYEGLGVSIDPADVENGVTTIEKYVYFDAGWQSFKFSLVPKLFTCPDDATCGDSYVGIDDIKIEKATLKISVDEVVKSKAKDVADPTFTYTVTPSLSTKVLLSTFTGSITRELGEDIAAYDFLSTLDHPDYTVEFTPAVFNIVSATTLSNEANTVAGLQVYPNPASDVVYVSAVEAIESVSLVNALGQTVAAPFNGTSVDVAALPNGVYILTVVAGGKSSAQKVLVD